MFFVITGPSGCGKSTLTKQTLGRVKGLLFSVSHTTRKKRSSEEEGRDYYFVSRSEFEKMIEEKKFVEWAAVHGHYYGTSKKEIDKKRVMGDLVLDIDVQGAKQVRSKFKKAVFIFILPPTYQELRKRLIERGQESDDSIRRRLELAKKEVKSYPLFDYIVINDYLDKAVQELEVIILSARYRLAFRKKEILPILQSFSED